MLINITGIDGCGKSTQLHYLADLLTNNGKDVFHSKAYGVSEKEKFSPFVEQAHDLAIMFLFQAMHVQQRIRAEEALENGKIVLADRWNDAYFAYHSQYGVLALDVALREKLDILAFNGLVPDVTFFLRVPVVVAMKRCDARGADFFDRKGKKYHQSMSDQLDQIAKEKKWYVINGTRNEQVIHKEIVSVVNHLLL